MRNRNFKFSWARLSGSAEAELQIFTGQVERKCGSGTSDFHKPSSAESELQLFMGQVEQKCGSGTSEFHRPGRAEVRNRNFSFSWARLSGNAEVELQIFTS